MQHAAEDTAKLVANKHQSMLCIFAWQPLEISRSMILLPFQIYETSVNIQNICGGSVGLGDGGQSAELPTPAGAPGPRCRS